MERELVSRIQNMRKEAGFEVTDRITVNYIANDKMVINAFEKGKELKEVVLADEISACEVEGFKKELDINGATCTVIINKVNK